MSLIDSITDKVSGGAIVASRALSKITDTTFAEVGTSLSNIKSDSYNAARSAIDLTGVGSSLDSPLVAMRNAASALGTIPAPQLDSLLASAQTSTATSFNNSLPGYNYNLYDLQTGAKSATAAGVDSYYQSLYGLSQTTAITARSAGLNQLPVAYGGCDVVCSAGFGAATSSVTGAVSNISNALADKVKAANKVVAAITSPITSVSNAISNIFGAKGVSSNERSTGKFTKAQTDIIHQPIKVYIEGVQIPYNFINVSSGIGQLPTASVGIPPQASLMDIVRYYSPKVHIFFTDPNLGGDRLLFWGHAVAVNYSKSQQQGAASIVFECEHKNMLLEQLTLEWSGSGMGNIQNTPNNTNPDQAVVQVNNFNSTLSIIRSLQGITGKQTDDKDLLNDLNTQISDADITKLAQRFANFEKRLVGMPGSVMNMWNQLKQQGFTSQYNYILTKVYIPLLEDGIAFFDRISGHHVLENQIEGSRQKDCLDASKRPSGSHYDLVLPHTFRMNMASAEQTNMAVAAIQSKMGFSNEMANFHELFVNFYYAMEYEMLTLTSPAEVPLDPAKALNPDDAESWDAEPKMAVETIIKPQIPFYYSPLCNVILPNMFSDISISQSEKNIPTRVTVINGVDPGSANSTQGLGINYRAPNSIREAVARGSVLQTKGSFSLAVTRSGPFGVPGKYELGRGILHKKISMPFRLSVFAKEKAAGVNTNDETLPDKNSAEYKALTNIHLAWVDRYGYDTKVVDSETVLVRNTDKDSLNPYNPKANISPYERLLFAAADYDYTKEVIRSKTGDVQTLFNPYIVPGYPMDIIQASPTDPSFHALCASVSHSITASSISTSVSFVSAVTYNELSMYFIQPLHPWLQDALSMINIARNTTGTAATLDLPTSDNTVQDQETFRLQELARQKDPTAILTPAAAALPGNPVVNLGTDPLYDSNKGSVQDVSQTLINNPRAKAVADEFYRGVFGVGAAGPDDIFDYQEGLPFPISRQGGKWYQGSSSHSSENGFESNDYLTGAGNLRLVSRPIETKASIETKFGLKFINLTTENYNPTFIYYRNPLVANSRLLEPGASPFLDYEEIETFLPLTAGAGRGVVNPTADINTKLNVTKP